MTLNDVLADALEGIDRHQRDNPDPKLDALWRHIAVVLDDLEAATPPEYTYAEKVLVMEDAASGDQPKGG